MKVIAPGGTIGILGGGQLGRMTALAAAKLGYRCHIFCPDADEPAVAVAAAHTQADFKDRKALEAFAAQVDVVTMEWENIPLEALEILAPLVDVHPSADVLRVSQDRGQEKAFARRHTIGTAEFVVVHSAEELGEAMKSKPMPAILKSTRMGYDGKGQVRVAAGDDPVKAWNSMGSGEGILEALVDFDCEVSVIVARRADGVMAAYPAVKNTHRNQILAVTQAPAEIDVEVAEEAIKVAELLTEKLKVVGLLAVEMFVLKQPDALGKRVLMNEVAPRPHNSGHWTMDACACSQFEQLVRAICGLPLGSTAPHSSAEMHNLIGDEIDGWQGLLAEPDACLHIYGKKDARPSRKMGHVTYLKKS